MRIAIINHGIFPFLVGGMERHTHFLATHLAKLGAEVDVIVPQLKPEQVNAFTDEKHNFRLLQFPWPPARVWLHSNYLFSKAVNLHLLANGYDAVYAQGFNGWAYLREVPRERRALTVVNLHGMEMFKTVGAWQTAKHVHMRIAAREQARLADRVISSGGHLTGETRRFLKVSNSRIDVIPNAVDMRHIARFARPGEHARTGNGNNFVFVGRLAANKGVQLLCEAFVRQPAARLSLIGSGPLEPALRERFTQPNIRFLGSLSDEKMFVHLREADCFAFASLYEGMPTVILEAMAVGLPIIATDIGAVTTMVDSKNGFVVAPGSSEQMEQAVIRFLMLPAEEKARMGCASRQHVEERFTWPRVARQTLEVLMMHARTGADRSA